jgi:hypothetical protein
MLSPQVVQQYLFDCSWKENEISTKVIVPTLEAFRNRHGRLEDIRFVGGTSEEGSDIEYYELIGPDEFRLYTGIQVKKGDVGQEKAEKLAYQGRLALEKVIKDRYGHSYRVGRWSIATTGSITDDAKTKIINATPSHGKLVHFWDGLFLGDLIMRYWHNEFIKEMGIAAPISQNVLVQAYPPQLLVSNCVAGDFVEFSIPVPREVAYGLLLTVEAADGSPDPVDCIVRTPEHQVTINSLACKVQAPMLRLYGSVAEIKNLNPSRAIHLYWVGMATLR